MIRFTIRDVLWLTVVVALGVAWWIDRASLKASLLAELESMRQTEYKHYQYEVLGGMPQSTARSNKPRRLRDHRKPGRYGDPNASDRQSAGIKIAAHDHG